MFDPAAGLDTLAAKAERVRNRNSHNIALRTTMRVPPPGMASVVVSLPESAQPCGYAPDEARPMLGYEIAVGGGFRDAAGAEL